MKVTVRNVRVSSVTVDPSLEVEVQIDHLYEIELPISISARVSVENRTVALMDDNQSTRGVTIPLKFKTKRQKEEQFSKANGMTNYQCVITAYLSPRAIEHIETIREANHEKAIHLVFDFTVKFLDFPAYAENLSSFSGDHLHINYTHAAFREIYTIKQSDWVNHFSKPLGLGNFILFEYVIPEPQQVPQDWQQLYDRLFERTQEMEEALRKGEWKQVMIAARQFYENSKVGDKKANHKPFEESFKKLYLADQHTEEGFQHLMDAIYHLFEFTSKFIHDKSKTQQIQPIPNATKEDAYLAFALCTSLLNVIGKKLGS